jgi:hypothetical protein
VQNVSKHRCKFSQIHNTGNGRCKKERHVLVPLNENAGVFLEKGLRFPSYSLRKRDSTEHFKSDYDMYLRSRPSHYQSFTVCVGRWLGCNKLFFLLNTMMCYSSLYSIENPCVHVNATNSTTKQINNRYSPQLNTRQPNCGYQCRLYQNFRSLELSKHHLIKKKGKILAATQIQIIRDHYSLKAVATSYQRFKNLIKKLWS